MKRIGAMLVTAALGVGALVAMPAPARATTPKIGFYDTEEEEGSFVQVPPIETAGGEAVYVDEPSAAQLANLDVLFVQNPDNGGVGSEWLNYFSDISAWVAAGGTLIFHDRWVGEEQGGDVATTFIGDYVPGAENINAVRNFDFDADIDVLDPSTTVTDGPGGVIDDTTLDNGSSSSHGYMVTSTLPNGAVNPLARGDEQGEPRAEGIDSRGMRAVRAAGRSDATRLGGALQTGGVTTGGIGGIIPGDVRPDEIVTTCYPLAAGHVIYSTIPLDFYLSIYYDDGVDADLAFDDMALIYAPNVVAWGMEDCGDEGGVDVRISRLTVAVANRGTAGTTAQVELENMMNQAVEGTLMVSVHLLGGGATYRARNIMVFVPAVQRRLVAVPIRSPLPLGFGFQVTHIVLACFEVPNDINPADNCARRLVAM